MTSCHGAFCLAKEDCRTVTTKQEKSFEVTVKEAISWQEQILNR